MLDMVRHALFSVIIKCHMFCDIILQLQNARFCVRRKKHDGCNMKMVLITYEGFI
jgi:hypothetical protein